MESNTMGESWARLASPDRHPRHEAIRRAAHHKSAKGHRPGDLGRRRGCYDADRCTIGSQVRLTGSRRRAGHRPRTTFRQVPPSATRCRSSYCQTSPASGGASPRPALEIGLSSSSIERRGGDRTVEGSSCSCRGRSRSTPPPASRSSRSRLIRSLTSPNSQRHTGSPTAAVGRRCERHP